MKMFEFFAVKFLFHRFNLDDVNLEYISNNCS